MITLVLVVRAMRKQLLPFCVLWGLWTSSPRSIVLAQPLSREISSVPACARCTLHGSRVLTLGTESDSGLLGAPPLSVVRDARGAWWVSVHRTGEPIHVFDALGRLQRTIGARGGGPGEFVGPLMLSRSTTDTMYIYDSGASRITALHSGGGPMVHRPSAISGIEQFAVSGDGRIVVNASVTSVDAAGLPLHLLDAKTGLPSRSFGAVEAVYRHDFPRVLSRRVIFADDDHLWSVLPTRYVLERWNIRTARVEASLTRRSDSFKPHWLPEIVAPNPSTAPAPYIIGSGLDPSGRIWVYSLMPDPNWRRALGPKRLMGGREIYPVTDIDRYYDTLVEIIDPASGRLVASHRVDPALTAVAAYDHAAGMDHSSSAIDRGFFVVVWKFTLANDR